MKIWGGRTGEKVLSGCGWGHGWHGCCGWRKGIAGWNLSEESLNFPQLKQRGGYVVHFDRDGRDDRQDL